MKAPTIRNPFAAQPLPEQPDIEAAALRSDRFRLEREGDWRRLEQIVRRLERGFAFRLSDEDIMDLPVLYRQAASSLAVARETSLDAATLRFLEDLVQRAWYQVYGPRSGLLRWLGGFFRGGWSRAVRAIWLDILLAFAAMAAGVAAGWLLVARNVEWYFALVPGSMADARVPGASRAQLAETLAIADGAGGLSAFAAQLFYNNASVCILAFALGFAFGVPTLLLLIYNMALLGAMAWLYNSVGLLPDFLAWLSVHGTTELTAILLAGAAGVHVGRRMAFPGDASILSATAEAGRRAALVMLGCVFMLIFAAILEAFPRQLAGPEARAIIGAFMAIAWTALFVLVGREHKGASAP
ncbi:stage II sporulation protein M [Citromicrobium bathyomarinum]